MNQPPPLPEGYRFLEIGEIVEQNDLYWRFGAGPWTGFEVDSFESSVNVGKPLSSTYHPHIRRIETPLTDAEASDGWSGDAVCVSARFARELEVKLYLSIRENQKLRAALEGIISIGKRDLTNPKYDGYFEAAREALNNSTKN